MRADDLFQQHAPELSGFFHRRLGSPDQAADLCQEVYLRLRRLERAGDVAVLRDATGNHLPTESAEVATLAKAVPIPIDGLASIDRAISTAGGVALDALDDTGMLVDRPGTWVAGEMVAWDAPTGGYLIQACLSTGRRAGLAAARWAADHA